MKFYMPTLVYEEAGCVKSHAKELAAFGSKALIVTGTGSAEKNGALVDVKDALESNGRSWFHFNQVEENPSVETIMAARDAGVQNGCDFVIGIGGGSPMDAAKAIALMMKHKDSDWTYMYDKEALTDPYPVVLVPTTCGTGSEVTAISVLTRHDLKTKGSIPHRIFAQLSLLDPSYLRFAPQHILTATSMDAYAHLTESYINATANTYSRMCVCAGLRTWKQVKDVMLGKREARFQDYENMLNASMFAGMAIAHTGTALPHGLSYKLTYDLGMAHGTACGYFLTGYMKEAPELAKDVLHMSGFEDLDAFTSYYEKTCKPQQVEASVLEQTAADLLAAPQKLKLAPFGADEAAIRRIVGI